MPGANHCAVGPVVMDVAAASRGPEKDSKGSGKV